jgi:hypothetical protein
MSSSSDWPFAPPDWPFASVERTPSTFRPPSDSPRRARLSVQVDIADLKTISAMRILRQHGVNLGFAEAVPAKVDKPPVEVVVNIPAADDVFVEEMARCGVHVEFLA